MSNAVIDPPAAPSDDAYGYRLIRRAIDRLDAPGGQEMSLEEIARDMGLSPAHFQRLFSRWAGISPKRYQQWLRLGHARRLLAERRTMLETADSVGLSGSGRLHDLFVTWEAMSPGEYARAGQGLTLAWGAVDSPFGPAVVMATGRGIAGLGFAGDAGTDAAFADLARRWPEARFAEDPGRAAALAAPLWDRGAAELHLFGGPFQIKVWEALLAIPEGRVATYSDIARGIGAPKASRAVGSAVGRNPVAWAVPCHRVLRRDGALGGYHWGLPVKRAMLAWETAEAAAEPA